MSTETNVNSLIINKMSETKYSQITPIEGQMYATPDTHIATKEWTESRINDIMNNFNTTFNEYKELMKPNSYFYKWTGLNSISTAQTHTFTFTCKRGNPIYLCLSGDINPDSDTAWAGFALYKGDTKLTFQIAVSHGKSWNIPFSKSYMDTDVIKGQTYTYKYIIRENGSGTITYQEEGNHQSPTITVFEL